MAYPAYIKFHCDGSILKGQTIKNLDLEDVFEVQAFDHEIGNGRYEDRGYRKVWTYSHKSITLIMEADTFLPALYTHICSGAVLDQVEIFWPQFKSKEHQEAIYFTTIIHPVKLRSVAMFFPNVKDKLFERYPHLARIQMRYHWIEWNYVKGSIAFKGEWPNFMSESIQDDKTRDEFEELLNKPMSDEEKELSEYWDNKNKKKPVDPPKADKQEEPENAADSKIPATDERLTRLNTKYGVGGYDLGTWDCSAFVSYVLFNGNPRITTEILLKSYKTVSARQDWDVMLFQYKNHKGEPRSHMALYYNGNTYEHRDYGSTWRKMPVQDFVDEVENKYNSTVKLYRP
jgi:type VI secretion system Hcp family effector